MDGSSQDETYSLNIFTGVSYILVEDQVIQLWLMRHTEHHSDPAVFNDILRILNLLQKETVINFYNATKLALTRLFSVYHIHIRLFKLKRVKRKDNFMKA